MKKLILSLCMLTVVYSCQKTNRESEQLTTKVSLMSPEKNASVAGTAELRFSWAVAPTPNSESLYKIRIVEITGDQSPEQALRCCKPHFEKDSLIAFSFIYPKSAMIPQLKLGSKYGWEVILRKSKFNAADVLSEAGSFSVK
ncbi:hypothetical protein [Daejeonella sp.]|uniref:hypothetical protein n=1 Tax=Daejeonella sp. TaxID=2805397 RepID=UPI003983B07C